MRNAECRMKFAPPRPVTETIPKMSSPTVRAVARRSIMLIGSEGVELEQTRLRPRSRGKSSKAKKTKTVLYEGKESLEENHWFSSKSCSLVTFCHDGQKVTMPRNCSIRMAVQSGAFKDMSRHSPLANRLSLQGLHPFRWVLF